MRCIFLILISLIYLSSCVYNPDGYAKKSVNDKLFDTKGSKFTKRRPLYNKKYIDRAKRNILENRYDEDYDEEFDEIDEIVDPAEVNTRMYKEMIKDEISRKKNESIIDSKLYNKKDDIDLNLANKKINNNSDKKDIEDLKKELDQIKTILNETKKDLSKFRCNLNILPKNSILPKDTLTSKNMKETNADSDQCPLNSLDKNMCISPRISLNSVYKF